MNISLAVERHRRHLTRIIATLFSMAGLVEGESIERLPAPVYRAVLRLLRPAESAVRRLIVVVARGIKLAPPRPRSALRPLPGIARKGHGRPAFRLFDPRQRFTSAFAFERSRRRINLANRPEPRLRIIDVGFDPRVPFLRKAAQIELMPSPPSAPEGTLNAARLGRRLLAIRFALQDLPRQARRYLRWQSRPQDQRRPQLASALRAGTPPGFRKNPVHKVDEILRECEWLARHTPQSDTS